MGFGVFGPLIRGTREIGVSVRVHGIGDGHRVIGGEIHVQGRGVGAVGVLDDEHVVLGRRRRGFLLREFLIRRILVFGRVDVLDARVETFDPVLADGRVHVAVAGEAHARRDYQCERGGEPTLGMGMG